MDASARLLRELHDFVLAERAAAAARLLETWRRPLADKLQLGLTQRFLRVEAGPDGTSLWAYPDRSESRFREGDMLILHAGSPIAAPLQGELVFESEEEARWLLRARRQIIPAAAHDGRPCYADQDAIDLTPWYLSALDDIGGSVFGRTTLLPLLTGELAIRFDQRDVLEGERAALAEGLNARQALAVGMAFGACQIACIQGPPGTGKTRVLAHLARLLVARGERVLVTAHTHTAINHALNKVAALGVAVVKVGRVSQRKGLDAGAARHDKLLDWAERPDGGYVAGATPFATCSRQLEGCTFDTVLFDEASQITVPLALMAMRAGKRFIFIGDQKQLGPVLLSRSVLAPDCLSVFARLTAAGADHTVMLSETYRMNRWLSDWPGKTHYGGALVAAGANRERQLHLDPVDARLAPVFDPQASGIFIPTLDRRARTSNARDAALVVALCAAAVAGGLALESIGVVTPYRAQGRTVRTLLARRFGRAAARGVVADTVERMQGQEREMVILTLASGDALFLDAVAGFFFLPERLNVSITRAVCKLVVIGPPAPAPAPGRNPQLAAWIAQYDDLIAHLQRVDL